jgi:hypothetical protein
VAARADADHADGEVIEMLDGTEPVVKGATFEWDGAVHCKVHRVAEDGTYADFTMTQGGSSWGKRMPLPLPASFVRIS